MATVYLIMQPSVARDKPPLDLTPLYEHGDVKVLLPAGSYPTYQPDKCRKLIREGLAGFDETKDRLVWAGGDTLAAVMAGIVLERMGVNEVMWLRIDRKLVDGKRVNAGMRYVPVKVSLITEDERTQLDHEAAEEGH